MAQTLAFEQSLARQAPRPETGFGLRPTLGVLLAFLAIHAYLALRLPLAHMEASVLARDARLLVDLPHLLSILGQSISISGEAARAGFVLVSTLTSLAVFAATRQLTRAPLAPAIAVIWLNTSILFGIGSALATREAPAGLGLATALIGLAAARRTPGALPWIGAILGLAIAATSHAAAPFALLGAPIAMVPDKAARNWVQNAGFGVFFGLVIAAAWTGFNGFHTGALPRSVSELALVALVLLGPGVLFFCLVGFACVFRLVPGRSPAVAAPVFMVLGLFGAVAFGIARPQDLAMLTPLLAAVAAVAACKGAGRVRAWVAEISTPLSFLLLLVAVYVTAIPTNTFLPRLAPVSGLFGWQGLAIQVENRADAAGAAYVLVDDRSVARALAGVVPRPVLYANPDTIWAVPNCTTPGLFLTRSETANALLGSFRQISQSGDLPRMAGAWAVDLFTVYRISDPTRQVGCTTGGLN